MNEIVNKYLLAGDKFMLEMNLKQPRLTYNACGPFTKNKERIQTFQETGDSRYIYLNQLHRACFQRVWLMDLLKNHLNEKLLIKSYVIKHLISIKMQNMMDIKKVFFQ